MSAAVPSVSQARIAPVIVGVAGLALSDAEHDVLRRIRPWGVMLHSRNCEGREQLADLIAALRDAGGDNPPEILLDQEGGPVTTLRWPEWAQPVPPATLVAVARRSLPLAERIAHLNGRVVAGQLREVGVTINVAPVLDLPIAGGCQATAARTLGRDPATASRIGWATCRGLIEGGALPVIKHMLGYGRARRVEGEVFPVVDAGLKVLAQSDFLPFSALRKMPFALAGNVVYNGIDREVPATRSPVALGDVVRGHIGFAGAVIADDLADLPPGIDRAGFAVAALASGCDLLMHGNGRLSEMEAAVGDLPPLSEPVLERLARATALRRLSRPIDLVAEIRAVDALVAPFASAQSTRTGEAIAPVVTDIAIDIAAGRLAPPARIREDELVYGRGLKRHAARSALAELDRLGLVEIAAYRGAAVRDYTADEVEALVELRAALHAVALRATPLPLRPATLRELARLDGLARSASDRHDHGAALLFDRAFHALHVAESRNRSAVRHLDLCEAPLMTVDAAQLHQPEGRARVAAEHAAILTALAGASAEAAVDAMDAHVRATFDRWRRPAARH